MCRRFSLFQPTNQRRNPERTAPVLPVSFVRFVGNITATDTLQVRGLPPLFTTTADDESEMQGRTMKLSGKGRGDARWVSQWLDGIPLVIRLARVSGKFQIHFCIFVRLLWYRAVGDVFETLAGAVERTR